MQWDNKTNTNKKIWIIWKPHEPHRKHIEVDLRYFCPFLRSKITLNHKYPLRNPAPQNKLIVKHKWKKKKKKKLRMFFKIEVLNIKEKYTLGSSNLGQVLFSSLKFKFIVSLCLGGFFFWWHWPMTTRQHKWCPKMPYQDRMLNYKLLSFVTKAFISDKLSKPYVSQKTKKKLSKPYSALISLI